MNKQKYLLFLVFTILTIYNISAQTTLGWYDRTDFVNTPKLLKSEGVPLVLPYLSSTNPEILKKYLLICEDLNVNVIMSIHQQYMKPFNGDAVRNYINMFKNYSAVIGWYTYDEPDHVGIPSSNLEEAYKVIKSVDNKPVYLVLTSSNSIRNYSNCADVLMVDYYPIMNGNQEYQGFDNGYYLRIINSFKKEADVYGKKTGLVIQAFGTWTDGRSLYNRRSPTSGEMQWMLYQAWSLNPNNIFFWVHYKSVQEWKITSLLPHIDKILPWVGGERLYTSADDGDFKSFIVKNSLGIKLFIINNRKYSLQLSSEKVRGILDSAQIQSESFFRNISFPVDFRGYDVQEFSIK